MRVLVDALSARVGGGLSFLKGQLGALEARDVELQVLTAPWNHDDLRASLVSPCRRVAVPDLARRFAYEQFVMPLAVKSDVLYCPGNFIPVLGSSVPRVLCVQNPNYFGRGRTLAANTTLGRRVQITLSRASVRRAEATVVISRSLHREMAADGLAGDRVVVVRSGASEWEVAAEEPDGAPGQPFFLSLANDYPHKRLGDLVAGWALARTRAGDGFPALAMVGAIPAPRREQLRALAGRQASGRSLFFAGSVRSRSHIRWLLEHCVSMVATSELEALPLVPVEAGTLGTPALLSDIPPHREVADGYATFFDVGDLDALADRLIDSADDRARRPPLNWPISWDEHAGRLLHVLERAAAQRGREPTSLS